MTAYTLPTVRVARLDDLAARAGPAVVVRDHRRQSAPSGWRQRRPERPIEAP
jgi:hypothetical protein